MVFMHSYLIVSGSEKSFDDKVDEIAKSSNMKTVSFSVQKVGDARDLKSFLALSQTDKTLIVIKSFNQATEECANALLKTIEEPQENITFAIHSKNENSVLPTIRSRCEIVRMRTVKDTRDLTEVTEFLEKDLFDMSRQLIAFKKRDEAIFFIDKLLLYFSQTTSDTGIKPAVLEKIEAVMELKKSLERNGNINLHMLKFLSRIR